MTRKLVGAVVCSMVALAGCGAETTTSSATTTASRETAALEATYGGAYATTASNDTASPTTAAASTEVDLASLPTPPWAGPRMSANEAPRQLLTAWESADNRDVCAPIATRTLGRATGARARTSELAGGWLVEFDRPGLPGIDRQGRECDTCGRSVFGIAGTSISPDALDPESDTLAPTYSDGSHAEVEVTDADGESVASVTFTVNGQGCVYEVWSLLGPDHLADLVAGLRFVDPPAVRGGALAAR